MELYLIVPVPEGSEAKIGDEEINERAWRVTGPHDLEDMEKLKFHCVSYVWGLGTEEEGSFFNCKRRISDQTRPALTAAIKVAEVVQSRSNGPIVEAFWIDAICIPQLESPERVKTLESMGFIYAAAVSVLVVLQRTIWEIIQSISSGERPRALSDEELQILEEDNWISRVWTYQELVNGRETYFTSLEPTVEGHAIHGEKFMDCVGFSIEQWKKKEGKKNSAVLEELPNLNTLEDTLADRNLGGYLDRMALGVLSNMALRKFDPQYPQNRLLACLGALTQEISWGPPSTTLAELSEKLMSICETNGDYSFIYTSDVRSTESGMRWRPNPKQPTGSLNLVPVVNWHSLGTQDCHRNSRGLWLDDMVKLELAEVIDKKAEKDLEIFLYGSRDFSQPDIIQGGMFHRNHGEDEVLSQVLMRFLRIIGFKGVKEPQVCKTGLFFSQSKLEHLDSIDLYAASGIRWVFGTPGLARWKKDGEIMYCAGVFTGAVEAELAKSLLLE